MTHFRWAGPALVAAIAVVSFVLPSNAQDGAAAATAPAATGPAATGPAEPGQSLTVKVAEVRGLVRVRNAPDQPWQKAVVGMELGEGAEFQTGPKSVCVCTIENDQTIVLDRLGVVSVAEAVKRGDSVRTDLLMKYGRTEYEIEAAGAKHDATIRSPSSTLAVRGTRVNLYDQPPFVPSAESYTGRAIYQYAKRQTALGGPGRGAVVRSDRNSAADSALGDTVVDPSIAEARTNSDAKLIETEVSRGALASFDERTGITVIKGGAGPPGDNELAQFLPGRFNVIARWTGNQDLNLVLDPDFFPADQILNNVGSFADNGVDEILFPGFSQNITATGGRTDFDHRGGTNGGFEVGFYPNPRTGIYGIIVLPGGRGGRDPANVKIQAFLDGNPIDMVFPQLDEQGNLVFDEEGFVLLEIAQVIERVVTSGETDVAGFTFVPSLEELLGPPPDDGGGEGGDGSGEPTAAPQQSASARAADNRAARRAALKAERDHRMAEKRQAALQAASQRLTERDQRKLTREAGRAREVDRKLGLSGMNGQMGPHALPKK
jgi:hypothetical protein